MKKNVALISGGYSKEDVISFNSAKEIAKSIDRNLFNVYQIFIKKRDWMYIDELNNKHSVDKNDFSIFENNQKISFDVALITIHGTPGEDGKLQGYFDTIGIPYTTCNTLTSALTFNKVATKRYLAAYGVKTAPYVFLRIGDEFTSQNIVDKLGLPIFVKPNAGGSSFGVTKVKTHEELIPAIYKAFEEDNEVIIESFIEGIEITCGLFKTKTQEYIFPATEIVSKNEFFDYEAKYIKGMADEITPARISDEKMDRVKDLSSKIYDWVDCRGVVRIDYLMKNNELFLIEINTVPGMSAASIIPQQAKAFGMNTQEMFTIVLQDTIG